LDFDFTRLRIFVYGLRGFNDTDFVAEKFINYCTLANAKNCFSSSYNMVFQWVSSNSLVQFDIIRFRLFRNNYFWNWWERPGKLWIFFTWLKKNFRLYKQQRFVEFPNSITINIIILSTSFYCLWFNNVH
jgi:hypothetical protein